MIEMNLKSGMMILALFLTFTWGQAQEEELGTETVTVVKSYSPSVSDAFKIKSLPSLEDSISLQKKPVNYSIFSVPVASTFTPAKGKAATVERERPEELFNSSVAVGLGNYNNALLDFYTSHDIDRGDQRLDIMLNHHSSRGAIESTPLDANFYDTGLGVAYSRKDRDFDWGASLNLEHRLNNWYGLPQAVVLDEATLNSIDETQNYFMAEAKANLNMEESPFTGGEILLRRFWDVTDSGENRIRLSPGLQFPLTEEAFSLNFVFDYVGGSFGNASLINTTNSPEINYSWLQAGVNPSLLILRDDLKINLGARIVFGIDMENSMNNFYIYPAVNASYRLLEDSAIVYGGVEGDLRQNSYYGLVKENPFVSPTLEIRPTDQQFDAFVGLKGQLLPNLSYNLKGSYKAENFRPLFLLNPENTTRDDEKAYYYGNSFQVFYDDLRTVSVFGEINVDVNRNFSLGLNARFNQYDTETDNPAWNLPTVEGSVFMDYQIGDQWFFGANLFYVGEREDVRTVAIPNATFEEFPATFLTLDGYFDANVHLGYRFNDQLSVFAKASNLANNEYQRWANFGVQGFQVLGGVKYKFDL